MCGGKSLSRGFTLIEILYSIALTGILFLALAQVELALRKTGAQYKQQFSVRALVDVRAWLLADIHRAATATVPESTRLLLTCGGKEVTWQSKGGRIVRTAGKHRMTWITGNPVEFTLGGPAGGCIVMTFAKADWAFVGCRP